MKYFDTLEIEDKKHLLRHKGELIAYKPESALWVLHSMYIEMSFTHTGRIVYIKTVEDLEVLETYLACLDITVLLT